MLGTSKEWSLEHSLWGPLKGIPGGHLRVPHWLGEDSGPVGWGALQVTPGLALAEFPVPSHPYACACSGPLRTTLRNSRVRHLLVPAGRIESGSAIFPQQPCALWGSPGHSHDSTYWSH